MDTNSTGYFDQVRNLIGAEFWANNPSGAEIEFAIANGAVGIATNPVYIAALLKTEPEFVNRVAADVAGDASCTTDDAAGMAVIRLTVERALGAMQPTFRETGGKYGHVAIQGNPRYNHDLDEILDEAEWLHELGENIVIKLPATLEGAAAMEELTSRGWPTIGTMSFTVSQYILMAEAHRRGLRNTNKTPLCLITMLPGLFDESIADDAAARGLTIAPDVLAHAGVSTARAAYKVYRERGYEARILSGGARSNGHWKEVVGPNMAITLGGSLALAVANERPEIVSRIEASAPEDAIAQLRRNFPDFAAACDIDALAPEEFRSYAPVVRFQNSFLAGFDLIVDRVNAARAAAPAPAGGRS